MAQPQNADSSSSQPSPPTQPVWHGLAAGAASGLAARILTFPTDTLKARLQIRGAIHADAVYSSTFSAAKHMLATEGLLGFYRGFGAVLWGVVPANLAYFGGYELGKAIVPGHLGMAGDMATGALAQLLAGIVYTPVDIVKERMQVQAMMRGYYSYASPDQAFRALLGGAGGGQGGLFRGYWVTNCVWLPWNCMYIAGYEQLKRQSVQTLGLKDAQELPPLVVAGCSATAAAGAALATHPADVVKTRLQVLTGQQSAQSLTTLKVAQQQLHSEGLSSFWHGLTPRLLNIAPGCALSWVMYEWLKGWLDSSSQRVDCGEKCAALAQ